MKHEHINLLSNVSITSIQQLFHQEQIDTSTFDWNSVQYHNVQPVVDFIQTLPIDQRTNINNCLANILILASPLGWETMILNKRLLALDDLLSDGSPCDNQYTTCFNVALRCPALFHVQLNIGVAEPFAWWYLWKSLPTNVPSINHDVLYRFEESLRSFFDKRFNGSVCSLHNYSVDATNHYYHVQIKGAQHQKELLCDPCDTLSAVFHFDSSKGILEIHLKRDNPVWRGIGNILIRTILDPNGSFRTGCFSDLSLFKVFDFPYISDAEDCFVLYPKSFQYTWEGGDSIILNSNIEKDLNTWSHEIINWNKIAWSEAKVTSACLEFCFSRINGATEHIFRLTFSGYGYSTDCPRVHWAWPIINKYIDRWDNDHEKRTL